MFDPFCYYDFQKSQTDEAKYGIAGAFLEYAETSDTCAAAFPPVDIRHSSTRRFVAWWVTLVHRIRKEGRQILVPLRRGEALGDATSRQLLNLLLSTPPSSRKFQLLAAPLRKELLATEAARLAFIRQAALAVCWGGKLLKGVPDNEHADILARSAALRQQEEAACQRSEDVPCALFYPFLPVDRNEAAALCHFLAGLFERHGMIGTEPYLYANQGQPAVLPIADPFLAYALEQAGQTWRDKATIRANLRRREKALLLELGRRFDALCACLMYLLEVDANPNHVLWLMQSFWPDDGFAGYAAAGQFLEEEGR